MEGGYAQLVLMQGQTSYVHVIIFTTADEIRREREVAGNENVIFCFSLNWINTVKSHVWVVVEVDVGADSEPVMSFTLHLVVRMFHLKEFHVIV